MLFQVLRRYFRDEQFDKVTASLGETEAKLIAYQQALTMLRTEHADALRSVLEDERLTRAKEDKKSVEVEFLAFLWTVLALVMAIWVGAASQLPDLLSPRTGFAAVEDGIRWVIAFGAMIFVILNLPWGLYLMKRYAQSKEEPGYRSFANELTIGVIVIFVCGLALSIIRISSFGN